MSDTDNEDEVLSHDDGEPHGDPDPEAEQHIRDEAAKHGWANEAAKT